MRYFFGFLAILLLIIIGLIFIFHGHGTKTPNKPSAPVMTLPDYAPTDAYVSMTMDGQINGDDQHRAIRISVSRDQRLIDIIQGYSGRVIDSHNFPNTEDAYYVFLKAINNAGFTVPIKGVSTNSDPTGKCPQGIRTTFALTQNVDTLSSLWVTSCDTPPGTLAGNASLLIDLFQAQIPNYGELTDNVNLD